MRQNIHQIILGILLISKIFAVGEAGAIFLLITPGAGPAGTGEAQVAKSDDAYASYFNPAGLAFLKGSEVALMHVNWLPNLADDLYYEYLGGRMHIDNLGTIGGHVIFLNLGEQTRTDEFGNVKGNFNSNMWALTGNFSTMLTKNSGIGLGMKIFQQNLIGVGTGSEAGKGISTDFAFDIGYLLKMKKLNFGLAISNIGPKISFIDVNQADPAPTNLRVGIQAELYNNSYNKVNLLFDVNKLLVSSYPNMDWDSDGLIGGYDSEGNLGILGEENYGYNSKGQNEYAHSDPWYLAIITSWLDDWFLGGDRDLIPQGQGYSADDLDFKVGGWEFFEGRCNTSILNEMNNLEDGQDEYCQAGTPTYDPYLFIDGIPTPTAPIGDNSKVFYPEMFEEEPYEDINNNGMYDEGEDIFDPQLHDLNQNEQWDSFEDSKYNEFGQEEKGKNDDRSIKTEFMESVYNIGIEYWYSENFAVRVGYIHDEEGDIKVPTMGAGLRFGGYGFDFGYTGGAEGHPRSNTMFFSINMEL
tara:strand:- start:622 stop:2196 length:1575 start_codon:yes stop_codon:yes gene_type:complete